jgi:mRNA interferase HicA
VPLLFIFLPQYPNFSPPRWRSPNSPVAGQKKGSKSQARVDQRRHNNYVVFMTARELKRYLAAKGCTFENHAGGSGHLTVRHGKRVSQLPMHGKGKELGTGLVQKILKDLGLKD